MTFWDASALVPLFIQQPATPELDRAMRGGKAISIWWGSIVECWWALARLRREGVRHSLRAADSLQLAAVLIYSGIPASGEFSCLDERLKEAARLEGLTTTP